MGRLLEALAGKRILLVLDNCEHLVDAAARLAGTILSGCPGVRILATSRAALGVGGEALWPVPSLRLPPPDVTAVDAPGYASVRLFVDRAAAVIPDFSLDGGNVAGVAQVCRRLDGMPLAIELAASRLRSLTVEQVAARLDDRFALLTGGSRTALPRHQTLRAVVDWSWDLLDPAEQTLLRRISVFAGGATLATAERVCAGRDLEGPAVLDLLACLVDKSLVEAEERSGEMRYRLLETVRAYATERLVEAGEAEAVRRGHADFFCELAELAEPELRGRDQLHWLDRLNAERDNLRAAVGWAVAAGAKSLALRLAVALSLYWSQRGYRVEGRALLAAALDLPGEVDPWLCATALLMRGLNSGEDGVLESVQADIETAQALYRDTGRRPHPTLAMVEPMFALVRGEAETARDMVARVLSDEGADAWTRASARLMAGHMASFQADLEAAESAFDDAAGRFRALGERWGLSQALGGLAEVAEARGEIPRAERAVREALDQAEQLGAREDMASLLIRLGALQVSGGDREGGFAQVEQGMRLARELGSTVSIASGYFVQGGLARRLGDLALARRMFEETLRVSSGREHMPPFGVLALIGLGFVAEQEGDADEARARHRQAIDLIPHGPLAAAWTPLMIAGALVGLAGAAAAAGDNERAATLLGGAGALRGAVPPHGDDRRDLERVTATARHALGAGRFERAHRRGAALTREEILEYAG